MSFQSELQDEKKNNEVKAQQLGGKEYENEQLKLGQKQLLEKERSLNEELKKANEAIDGVHHELDQVKTEHQRQMERLRKDLEERESALQELNDKVLHPFRIELGVYVLCLMSQIMLCIDLICYEFT